MGHELYKTLINTRFFRTKTDRMRMIIGIILWAQVYAMAGQDELSNKVNEHLCSFIKSEVDNGHSKEKSVVFVINIVELNRSDFRCDFSVSYIRNVYEIQPKICNRTPGYFLKR